MILNSLNSSLILLHGLLFCFSADELSEVNVAALREVVDAIRVEEFPYSTTPNPPVSFENELKNMVPFSNTLMYCNNAEAESKAKSLKQ